MKTHDANEQAGLIRNPDEWKSGDEPMTAAQRSYLETLCRETNQPFDDHLTKAEASTRIDELRQQSPRLAADERGDAGEIVVPLPGGESEAERRRIRSSNDRDQRLEREGTIAPHNRGYDAAADGQSPPPDVERVVDED
jgi:hypothetical protein